MQQIIQQGLSVIEKFRNQVLVCESQLKMSRRRYENDKNIRSEAEMLRGRIRVLEGLVGMASKHQVICNAIAEGKLVLVVKNPDGDDMTMTNMDEVLLAIEPRESHSKAA